MKKTADFKNNIEICHADSLMLLPNGTTADMNSLHTGLNNNVIVLGASGSKKTRSYVLPNLLAGVNSYVISDPKGNLYRKYAKHMQYSGYSVVHIDFIHPENSDGYNPFVYAQTSAEITRLAHYLIYAGNKDKNDEDEFWKKSAEILLSCVIGYFIDAEIKPELRTASAIARLLTRIDTRKIEEGASCFFDKDMEDLNRRYKSKHNGQEPWSYRQYLKFRQTPPNTMNCIMTNIQTYLGLLDMPEIEAMMKKPSVNFENAGRKKTVFFIEVSDTDRTRDILVNTFYSQMMNALCTYADEHCKNSRLPVPVRFILDDFGTNCRIDGFENMISNIRSRNISAEIILQSESQLKKGYGEGASTIIENCDTMIFMGGNDLTTAETVSRRANCPVEDILAMPVGTNWIFRRGEKPVYSRTIDIDEYDTV